MVRLFCYGDGVSKYIKRGIREDTSGKWGFFEIAGAHAYELLRQYQEKNYGTQPEPALQLFDDKGARPVQYPDDLEQIDRDMRKPIGEISPVKTKGIP